MRITRAFLPPTDGVTVTAPGRILDRFTLMYISRTVALSLTHIQRIHSERDKRSLFSERSVAVHANPEVDLGSGKIV